MDQIALFRPKPVWAGRSTRQAWRRGGVAAWRRGGAAVVMLQAPGAELRALHPVCVRTATVKTTKPSARLQPSLALRILPFKISVIDMRLIKRGYEVS